MSNKSQPDRVSPETAERERKRSNGRQKQKNVAARTNGSHHLFDAPLTGKSLSKPEPGSARLQQQNKATAADNKFVVNIDPSSHEVTLKKNSRIFGTSNDESTRALIGQVCGVLMDANRNFDLHDLKWALETIHGIGPKDEIEGLLAAQMIGFHNLTMKSLKQASVGSQTAVVVDAHTNRATKFARTFTTQMEALNRHRGKVGQQMVVGNVNVSDGGQAIVGQVSRDGQGKALTEDVANRVE